MRARFVVLLVALVLAAGLSSYALVHARLESTTREQTESALRRDLAAVRTELIEVEHEALDACVRGASEREFAAALRRDGVDARRAAFQALEALVASLGAARSGLGRPDFAMLVDAAGLVVSRDGDPNAMVGRDLAAAWPVVRRGLVGESTGLVTRTEDERAYLVASVRTGAGALVLGYGVADALAERLASRVGRTLVLYRSTGALGASIESVERRRQLEAVALDGLVGDARRALEGGELRLASTEAVVDDRGDAVEMGHGHATLGGEAVGVVLFVDASERHRVVGIADLLLGCTAIFVLLGIGLALHLARSVLFPVMELERGLLALSSGDPNAKLDLHGTLLGGVAYRIHELVTSLVERSSRTSPGRVARVR